MDIKDLFDENEKPLDNLVSDGGFSGIFRTVACVGDSLSSGEFERVVDGTKHYHDMFDYSWGQFFARMSGNKVYNFSKGGMTAGVYCDSFAENNGFWDKDKAAQAYIIAMGVNDITRVLNGEYEFGDVSDIDTENYNNNKYTLVGNYAKIIQRYKEIQPDAFFFLMTMPHSGRDAKREEYEERHASLLYELQNVFSNIFILDFRKYAPVYDAEFKKNFYLEGHMSATGYLLTGKMVASYIDYIIRHNMPVFKRIGFVGTGL